MPLQKLCDSCLNELCLCRSCRLIKGECEENLSCSFSNLHNNCYAYKSPNPGYITDHSSLYGVNDHGFRNWERFQKHFRKK